jgi:hypothetical protein
MIIAPYLYKGFWVFDDEAKGLVKEPFIMGIPDMIVDAVESIPNAREGFSLLFSASAFPGYQKVLEWVRADNGGNWYREKGKSPEGWLCPSLYKYFDEAPKNIYIQADPL